MSKRAGTFLLAVLLGANAGWLDTPHSRVAQANRLYDEGKYDEAGQRYGEALVDNPESALLNYNLANAQYKAGKFSDALKSYGNVRVTEEDPRELAQVAYNTGNTQFRLATALESEKPQDALKGYAQALAAYRRAIGADPADRDAKFNYELTVKRIEDLKKKIEEEQQKKKEEEQKKKDEQQQQEKQQEQQSSQGEQQQDQQENGESGQSGDDEQEKQEQSGQEQGDQSPQQADQSEPEPGQGQPGSEASSEESSGSDDGGSAAAAGDSGEQPLDRNQQEAAALLDSAKEEELSPEEFARRIQGGAVAEPSQDW